jgi:hypothetical protein
MLYGPGNSQPHKVVPCGRKAHGNGGGIDVHALKNRAGKGCGGEGGSTPPSHDGPGTTPKSKTPDGSVPTASGAPGSPSAASSAATGSTAKTGKVGRGSESSRAGVLGVSARQDKGAGGVLGAAATVATGKLPFTGITLLPVALIALALVGLGLTARRQARVPA